MYNRFNGPANPRSAATPGTPVTRPAANPYAAFPQGTRPAPLPQAHAPQGASGPYAAFPQGTRPVPPRPGADAPRANNISPAAAHDKTIASTGPTPPARPPRTDLGAKANGPQTPAAAPPTTQYANIPQTVQYANIPQSVQHANIPQPAVADRSLPAREQQQSPRQKPYMARIPDLAQNVAGKTAALQAHGRPAQPPIPDRSLPAAEPQAFPRQKPYIARIPDFSTVPQPAKNAIDNAASGVRPSAPAQQQRPPENQRPAPAQGANPYGKLSAAIMNQAAFNLKNGGVAKESPYGSMHPVAGKAVADNVTNPYGKMSPVEKTSLNAPGSQKRRT